MRSPWDHVPDFRKDQPAPRQMQSERSMEIYLLRDEKEVGPYPAEDVRSWLQEGHVAANELAWTEGLSEWQPLQQLLGLGADAVTASAYVPPEPEPEPEPEPIPVPKGPPASPRQKAFLSYMGISFSPELSEEEAELLTEEVTQNRKNAKRLAKWEDDRLDLHPEMFVAEIQARMKNRPNYFFKMVETEGADCFNGVTKAHCQVLVGYLDVNHPQWDAKHSEATWKYFFPAIAEKFPQLVRKEWRSKLKFKEAPRLGGEAGASRAAGRARSRSRLAIVRNFVAALSVVLMVVIVGGGAMAIFAPDKLPPDIRNQVESGKAWLAAFVRGDQPAEKSTASTKPAPGANAGAKKPVSIATPPPRMPVAPKTATSSGPAVAGATPAKAAMPQPGAAVAPVVAAVVPVAPTPLPRPTVALFDPHAFATPAPSATGAAPPDTGKSVTIVQPVTIQTTYGKVTIAAGTSVKLLGVDGDKVRVNYMNSPISVPATATDLSTAR